MWDATIRKNYENVYQGDLFQSLWDEHVNFCKDLHAKVVEFVESRPDIKDVRVAVHAKLFHELNKIRCPVLLIHGDKVYDTIMIICERNI